MSTIDLGKWPTMYVQGKSVTREQANEILILTMGSYFDQTNDREWADAVRKAFNQEEIQPYWEFEKKLEIMQSNKARLDSLGVLELEYMNNSRIASAYIGGAHGWMNWDGTIAADSSYNVGKWPSAETDLLAELTLIAEAFPYLHATFQFYADRANYDSPENRTLALEITVQNGTAEITEGEPFNDNEDDIDIDTKFEQLAVNLFSPRRTERGVSKERLYEAVEQVRAKAFENSLPVMDVNA